MSEWTVGTLKEYVDTRMSDADRRLGDARDASARATDAAERTKVVTDAKANEFRGQLADQAATLMPRAEADSRHASVQRQLDEQRTANQKSFDELRRLVWIAVGIAIAASIAIPMLLGK